MKFLSKLEKNKPEVLVQVHGYNAFKNLCLQMQKVIFRWQQLFKRCFPFSTSEKMFESINTYSIF